MISLHDHLRLSFSAVSCLLLAASVLVGLAAARRRLNIADDYFLAGRQLPWYAVATSLAGAGLGLESLLGMAGLAYLVGMAPATLCWGNFLAYSILLWVVLPYLVRKKLSSMGEFLERRYHPLDAGRLCRGDAGLHDLRRARRRRWSPAAAAVCEGGLGRPPEGSTWPLRSASAAWRSSPWRPGVYSIYGGLAATTWAGTLQLLVVLAGGVLLVAVGSHAAGGLGAVVKNNLAAAGPRAWACCCRPATRICPGSACSMYWFTLVAGLRLRRRS